MVYLGIDIAKTTHFAAAANPDGEVRISPFSFSNDSAGFSKLLSKINSFDKENLLIGLESTAHYGENLISFLFHLGYKVAVINPIQTASLRKSNIRKTKTDKVDTLINIKALILHNYALVDKRDIHVLSLRGLCRSRQNLVLLRTRSKIQLAAYVDQLFPELNQFFKAGLHIKVSYQLLKKHPSPNEVKSLHLTYLSNLMLNASRGKYTKSDAIHLSELAKVSVGIDNPALSIQIKHAIAQIELLSTQIDEVETAIVQIMDETASPIMSVPGIGYINGAMILCSIGDISRFSHPCKVLAFAGLDPSVIQSGNFTARSTKMSKRGSSMFRYALINAAHNVVRNNATFKQYYDLKVSQGKSHYNALGHTAHKLVRIIFTLLKKNITFNLA